MWKRIAKILFGIVLIPFCLGYTWQFVATVLTVRYKPDTPYYFFAGALAYLTLHLLFKKPIFTYVIGHELTHALFAMLFGGSIKSIQASVRGGRVTISKSNFIITLAPYFFPLYTFIAMLFYWIACATDVHGIAIDILIFLSGVTFAFHIVLTLIFLQTDQNDIREHGQVFSYPLIYLFNIGFGSFLIYVFLAENMDYLIFLAGGIIKTFTMTSVLLQRLLVAIHIV
ncbi:MAG TPA: M50 family metallopeptidase [Nitrospirota bacterium]|nr:M50 family metallopeptidase [Nitrospirota bacterium]